MTRWTTVTLTRWSFSCTVQERVSVTSETGSRAQRGILWLRQCRAVLFAAVILLAGADRIFAHHSFSATYDSSQKVELQGVVKEFVWRNPHSFLRIDVTEKDGTTKTWALEWGSITQLSESKMTRTSLRPGDVIIVSGEPARDESSSRLLLQSIKRPSDGFTWQGRVD